MLLGDPNREFWVNQSIVYPSIATTLACFFFLAFLMAGLLQKRRSGGETPHRVGREGIFRPYLLAAKHLAKLKDFSGLANYFKPV